jgi:hypothetical protein
VTPDTLKISEELQAADFTEKQAKALAHAIAEAQGDLVTKDFLRAELAGLRADLSAIRAELNIIKAVGGAIALLIIGQILAQAFKII